VAWLKKGRAIKVGQETVLYFNKCRHHKFIHKDAFLIVANIEIMQNQAMYAAEE